MKIPVNTAITLPVNVAPLTDDGDFKTLETAVAYNAAGLALKWNFVTTAGVVTQTAVTPTDTAGDYDWTNKGGAMYAIEVPASGGASINNNATGYGYFTGLATGVLPWRGPTIEFVPAMIVNSQVNGTDRLDVNVTHVADQSQTAQDLGADTNTLTSRITGTRAAYFDNLAAGPVATSAEVLAIQNNTTTSLIAPANILRPVTGSITLYIRVYLTDEVGNMEAPDAAPTLDVRNSSGTDLTARLGDPAGTLEGTGQYRWVYTSINTDAPEQILFEVTVVEGGLARKKGVTSWVTDNASTDFTSTDRTKLEAVYNKLPSNNIGDQTLLAAAIGTPAQAATALSSAVWTPTKAGYLDAPISSVSAPTVEEIDAELSATHGATAWGAATVQITPFSATVSGGEVSTSGTITAYQYTVFGPYQITVIDSAGSPVDLRGRDLRFMGYGLVGDVRTSKYFEIALGDEAVGGAGHNVLTVLGSSNPTQVARGGLWVVFDALNEAVVAKGALKIPPVPEVDE